MRNKKLSVFPVSSELMPLIRHSESSGYDIHTLIAPKAFGYWGRDAGFVDGGSSIGKIVVDSVSDDEIFPGEVLYIDFHVKAAKEKYVSIIKKFSQNGGKIVASRLLKIILLDLGVPIEYIGGNPVELSLNSYLYMINVPTVLILGAGEQTDKFDIQLNLRDYFISKGYSVLQYGSKDYSAFLGFLPLPDFMFDAIGFEKKVLSLNSYLYTQISDQKPDVLILGVPGGIQRASIKEPRYFGELAYVISNSVNPDVCIMSLYNSNHSETFLSELKVKLKHCFNESLFSNENHFLSRDIAYLLLELEKEYDISIDDFVGTMDELDAVYSVEEIVKVLCGLVQYA